MQRVFALLLLVSVALAALTTNGAITVQANSNTNLALTSKGTNSVTDGILQTALGITANSPSISVQTDVKTDITLAIDVDANVFGSVNVAAGGNVPYAGLLGTLGTSSAVSVSLSASTPANIVLTFTTIRLVASVVTNQNIQYNLLASANDASAGASGSTTVYGACAVSVTGNTYSYTIPINTPSQLFLVALDVNAAASSSSSGSSSSSSDATNAGSNAFNYQGMFIPVLYGASYNLTVGRQYAYGNNILVTPIGTSGNNGGQLSVNYVSQFGSGASSPPQTSNGGYYNGYYQITGTNTNNVLQWSASLNGQNSFISSSGNSTTSQIFGTAHAKTVQWYKAAGTGVAAAGDWKPVSSTSAVTASGRLSVFANVNTYSQWTVASSSGASSTGVAMVLIVATAMVAMLF